MPSITVPAAPPLATVRAVELMRAGQWSISTGTAVFTTADLASAVAALDCPAVRRPVLKLGHSDPRFDGEPAVGWVDGMVVTDGGATLIGDYVGMPGWLGDVIASAYPDRSVEGVYDLACQVGHIHPFVVTAVALLGVTAPGIGNLGSLIDVAALYGVAASSPPNSGVPVAVTVRASKEPIMPNPRPTQVAAGVTTEDVRRQYYDDAGWSYWITEFHLDPLQLIVCDDNSGKYYRVPVTVTGDDTFAFGAAVEVVHRYEDKPAAEPVAASRLVYASRAESRPGLAPVAAHAPADAPPVVDPPPPDPADTSASADVPAAPDAAVRAADAAPQSPAAEPVSTEPKGDPVSTELSGIRSRLGLPDDADQDAVNAAVLADLDARPKPTDPEPDPDPEPIPAPAPILVQQQPEPVKAREPETVNASAANAEYSSELKRLSDELAQIKAREAAQIKASILDGAVKAGKIKPADKGSWEKRYDKAPDVITDVLASIAAGTAVPVDAAGVTGPGEPEDDTDSAFDEMMARLDGPVSTSTKGA